MADPTEYYVDHDNGNDSTGDGSSGTPWKTVEHALDTGITPDTSGGDRIWVTGTGGETMTKTWGSLVFKGPYGDNEPLQIIGYGSTTGDGVAAPIIKSASTYYMNIVGTADYVNWMNVNFQHNGTAAWMIVTYRGNKFQNCHFSRTVDTTGGYLDANGGGTNLMVENCSFVDCGTVGAVRAQDLSFINNTVKEQSAYSQVVGGADSLVESQSASSLCHIEGNIIITAGGYGIRGRASTVIRNNSIYCEDSSVATRGAITTSTSAANMIVENNIISSFNGTNHAALRLSATAQGIICRNNTFYDVTAVDTNTPSYMIYEGNETVETDPFTDAANGDFTPVDTGSVREGAYPSAFPSV